MAAKNQTRNTKKYLLGGVVVALLISGGFLYALSRDDQSSTSDSSKKLTQAQKDSVEGQLDRENQTPTTNTSGSTQPSTAGSATQITPIISRLDKTSSSVEAAGYIPNIYEDGGTCTFEFTRGSAKVSKTSSGFSDASTTICTAIEVPLSEFSGSGEWNLMIKYSSPAYQGTSTNQKIKI